MTLWMVGAGIAVLMGWADLVKLLRCMNGSNLPSRVRSRNCLDFLSRRVWSRRVLILSLMLINSQRLAIVRALSRRHGDVKT